MSIRWKKNPDPSLIVKELSDSRFVKDRGDYNFEAFTYHRISTLLYNFLEFPADIPEIDARQMVHDCLKKLEGKNEIKPNDISTELNKKEIEYLTLPKNRYVLLTSISLDPIIKIGNIHLSDIRLFFEKRAPNKFANPDREELIKIASSSIVGSLPNNYLSVRVHTGSRTIYHAADKALDNLDFIRGIWNWLINRAYTDQIGSSTVHKPINKILLGPIHTLHNLKGEVVGRNEWWYEPKYLGPLTPYQPKIKDLELLIKSQANIRKLIKGKKYSNDIRTAIIRYTRALDDRDMTSAYIKLWSLVEFLTNTQKGSGHDITVRRIASLYEKRDFHFNVLQILKELRNSHVHSGNETIEAEAYLLNLKNYADSLLHFHITNKFNFDSMEKVGEFLDLPVNEKDIKYKIKLYKYLKDFHHVK